MNWTIIWLDGALNQLASATVFAWGTPVSEENIRAMSEVERLLELDPTTAGESRPGHKRVIIELPLSVDFEVYPDQRTAIITRARYKPKRQ